MRFADILFSDSLGSNLGGEVWRGGNRKNGYPPQTGIPRPWCAAISLGFAVVAGVGCKTPTP